PIHVFCVLHIRKHLHGRIGAAFTSFYRVVQIPFFWFTLHGCLGICLESTTKFPSNFWKAIFTTYFFLVSTQSSLS
ncbi:hypothetical protein EDD21DRAFT_408824, partial [Dissophora ornata]